MPPCPSRPPVPLALALGACRRSVALFSSCAARSVRPARPCIATMSAAPVTVPVVRPDAPTVQRRFAPLQGRAPGQPVPPLAAPVDQHHRVLRGVVFDVDGTLCLPQNYMFGQMRAALGISAATDILDHIYGLPTPAAQHEAMEAVRAIERQAMARQQPQPGLAPLMDYLAARGLPKGICTRNFDTPVHHLLSTFLAGHAFAPIVTRDFRPPKPDPAGILHIARSWGLVRGGGAADSEAATDPAAVRDELREEQAEEAAAAAAPSSTPAPPVPEADASALIMVGDSIDDMTAGRRAGAATVLLVNDANRHLAEHPDTDLVIARLDDLIDILENGFVGRPVPQQTR